jgi:hypothetical protein
MDIKDANGHPEAVDSLCAKLEMKLQSIIANLLTEMGAFIWLVWRDIKI